MHFFDEALQLQTVAESGDGHYSGTGSPAYWNMVGPFGGVTAATLLQAILQHPARLGDPIALTVNFAAAPGPGAFTVTARPVRTNRSTQHWQVELAQADAGGHPQVLTTATAVTAARRETWGVNDTPMPSAPSPEAAERRRLAAGPAWLARYDMRPLAGHLPDAWSGAENGEPPDTASLSRLWVRDDPPRPLDFASLAALCDVFYPRAWLRRQKPVPAGTVSFTVYFHADAAQLAATGNGYLLGEARAQAFRNGFFDQAAKLWNEAGVLLATSHQLVYYKE